MNLNVCAMPLRIKLKLKIFNSIELRVELELWNFDLSSNSILHFLNLIRLQSYSKLQLYEKWLVWMHTIDSLHFVRLLVATHIASFFRSRCSNIFGIEASSRSELKTEGLKLLQMKFLEEIIHGIHDAQI